MNFIGTRVAIFSATTGNLILMFKHSLSNITFELAKQTEIYFKIHKSRRWDKECVLQDTWYQQLQTLEVSTLKSTDIIIVIIIIIIIIIFITDFNNTYQNLSTGKRSPIPDFVFRIIIFIIVIIIIVILFINYYAGHLK